MGIAQTVSTTTDPTTTTDPSTTTTTTTTTTVVFEGCTPGYWKVDQHFDSWVGLLPTQTVDPLFNVPNALGIDGKTLAQVLGPPNPGAINGSGPNGSYQLLRHAIAGILNANSPDVDYPFAAGDIVLAVNVILATQNQTLIEGLKNILAAANERRCPLN